MKYPVILLAILTGIATASEHQVSESQKPFVKKYADQKKIVPPDKALINTDAEPDLTSGFTSLYDGKTLEGWTLRGGECRFEAKGEMIVGTCVPGSPSTYLSTKRENYKDFVFTAEMKWAVDGNSGIMFRSKRKPGKKFEDVYGPQCEMEGYAPVKPVMDRKRGWSGGIYGQGYAAWIYPLWLDAHKEARQALKEDDWNRVTIKAVGDTVKTWVNGVPAAHWKNDEFLEGFFALQVHAGREGEVHFRNLKVKELKGN